MTAFIASKHIPFDCLASQIIGLFGVSLVPMLHVHSTYILFYFLFVRSSISFNTCLFWIACLVILFVSFILTLARASSPDQFFVFAFLFVYDCCRNNSNQKRKKNVEEVKPKKKKKKKDFHGCTTILCVCFSFMITDQNESQFAAQLSLSHSSQCEIVCALSVCVRVCVCIFVAIILPP